MVAGAEPRRPERVRDLVRALVELPVGEARAGPAGDDRRPLRRGLGEPLRVLDAADGALLVSGFSKPLDVSSVSWEGSARPARHEPTSRRSEFVGAHLATFKCPEALFVTDELPKTATSKVANRVRVQLTEREADIERFW